MLFSNLKKSQINHAETNGSFEATVIGVCHLIANNLMANYLYGLILFLWPSSLIQGYVLSCNLKAFNMYCCMALVNDCNIVLWHLAKYLKAFDMLCCKSSLPHHGIDQQHALVNYLHFSSTKINLNYCVTICILLYSK